MNCPNAVLIKYYITSFIKCFAWPHILFEHILPLVRAVLIPHFTFDNIPFLPPKFHWNFTNVTALSSLKWATLLIYLQIYFSKKLVALKKKMFSFSLAKLLFLLLGTAVNGYNIKFLLTIFLRKNDVYCTVFWLNENKQRSLEINILNVFFSTNQWNISEPCKLLSDMNRWWIQRKWLTDSIV